MLTVQSNSESPTGQSNLSSKPTEVSGRSYTKIQKLIIKILPICISIVALIVAINSNCTSKDAYKLSARTSFDITSEPIPLDRTNNKPLINSPYAFQFSSARAIALLQMPDEIAIYFTLSIKNVGARQAKDVLLSVDFNLSDGIGSKPVMPVHQVFHLGDIAPGAGKFQAVDIIVHASIGKPFAIQRAFEADNIRANISAKAEYTSEADERLIGGSFVGLSRAGGEFLSSGETHTLIRLTP